MKLYSNPIGVVADGPEPDLEFVDRVPSPGGQEILTQFGFMPVQAADGEVGWPWSSAEREARWLPIQKHVAPCP